MYMFVAYVVYMYTQQHYTECALNFSTGILKNPLTESVYSTAVFLVLLNSQFSFILGQKVKPQCDSHY